MFFFGSATCFETCTGKTKIYHTRTDCPGQIDICNYMMALRIAYVSPIPNKIDHKTLSGPRPTALPSRLCASLAALPAAGALLTCRQNKGKWERMRFVISWSGNQLEYQHLRKFQVISMLHKFSDQVKIPKISQDLYGCFQK